ncbi:MAG: extracellular solute-binding protein [Candidatus Aenigmatarchaeota archaeon]
MIELNRKKKIKKKNNKNKILILTLIFIIALIALAIFYEIFKPEKVSNKIVIYTLQGFMKIGPSSKEGEEAFFNGFKKKYNVEIEVKYFPNVTIMLDSVINGKLPSPDIFLGIDNILLIKAKKNNLLQAYKPEKINEIHSWLIDYLDKDFYSIPFSYVPLAIIINERNIPENYKQLLDNPGILTLSDKRISSHIVLMDPNKVELGLHFFALQNFLYEKILNKNWIEWWERIKGNVNIKDTLGKAYDYLLSGEKEIFILIGTSTDPIFIYEMNNTLDYFSAKPFYENNKAYSWIKVNGVSIAKNAKNPELAKKYIEYILSFDVQKYLYEGDWVYPANKNIEMPESYFKIFQIKDFEPLNIFVSQNDIEKIFDKIKEWNKIFIEK